jgi:2,3-bisphosphoglycerate-dependent phosphoglycerate mutase
MTDDASSSQAAELPSAAEQAEADPFLSLQSGATELYLIRHGDALPGADEIAHGDYDAQSLSALGRRQAKALAERLRESTPLAAVYCSPIGRAHETAAHVAAAQGLEVVIEPELREVGLGLIGPEVTEGLAPEEVAKLLKARLREIAVIAVTTGRWEAIPGSEPSPVLRARLRSAIAHIAEAHPGGRAAVVSHGGAINAYLASVLGLDRDYFFPAANTSISVVRVKAARAMLFSLNDITHLRAANLTGFESNS